MMAEPTFVIEQPVGSLGVHDLSPGTPADDAPVVLAVHGITANGLMWTSVAEELHRRHGPGTVRVLAPDLRGRAASREIPPPYGLKSHVEDLSTIVGVFGTKPLLVGHSMGGYIAAHAAATRPELFERVVLVDGGLAFPPPPGLDVESALQAVIGRAIDRLSMRFEDEAAYEDFWRRHPAVGPVLAGPAAEDVRRYVRHDLMPDPEDPSRLMSSCIREAVMTDGRDILTDEETHTAARRAIEAGVRMEFVWAARGLQDEPQGLYDEERLAALDLPDELVVHGVGGNHYDVILGGEGLATVVDAIDRGLGLA